MTLVWMAVENHGNRFILGEGDNKAIKNTLLTTTKERGIPVVLPLMDLQDNALLFSDIWGNFESRIVTASKRYDPDAILVGRVSVIDDQYSQSRWVLYYNNEVVNWSGSGEKPALVMADGVNYLADVLADKYASNINYDTKNNLLVHIKNLKTLSDFVKITRYLNKLDLTLAVMPVNFMSDEAIFSVTIQGDRRTLEQSLALGDLLLPIEIDNQASSDNNANLSNENIVYYQLNQ